LILEGLSAVIMEITAYWNVASCSLIAVCSCIF